jgi:hypothetical protein
MTDSHTINPFSLLFSQITLKTYPPIHPHSHLSRSTHPHYRTLFSLYFLSQAGKNFPFAQSRSPFNPFHLHLLKLNKRQIRTGIYLEAIKTQQNIIQFTTSLLFNHLIHFKPRHYLRHLRANPKNISISKI